MSCPRRCHQHQEVASGHSDDPSGASVRGRRARGAACLGLKNLTRQGRLSVGPSNRRRRAPCRLSLPCSARVLPRRPHARCRQADRRRPPRRGGGCGSAWLWRRTRGCRRSRASGRPPLHHAHSRPVGAGAPPRRLPAPWS